MAHYDDLDTPKIAVTGVISAIATFLIIVALQALYFRFENEQQPNAGNSALNSADSILTEQRVRMSKYTWIDPDKQRVSIPIDRAMELVVNESRLDTGTSRDESTGSDNGR